MQRTLMAAFWAVAACAPVALPAADLPPAGRSLFDHLTTTTLNGRSVQRVAYPLPALLEEIRRHAGTDSLGRDGMAAVLIPLGRSLQRNASAGEYFEHPRVVVAVTGETRTDAAPRLLLKDRLFLGFQDEAGVIEVISYNEHAGRFEFQVVTDYRPGGTPRVAYASRAVCSACHHAAAPIFSRPGWDETNANPAVARALAVHAASYHGVAVERGVDMPNAIDDAVARANRLALAQTLWRQGCDAVRAPADAVACRQALLVAALERRLKLPHSGGRGGAQDSSLVALAAAWKALWPRGLAEPDPNIPNRDPFFGRAQQSGAAGSPVPWGAEEIVPALDPMAARAPVALWRADASGMDTLLHTLGTFFAESDVRLIARALAQADRERGPHGAQARTGDPDRRAQPAAAPDGLESGRHDRLVRAVATLAQDTRAGRSDVLASAPFRRAAVLRALSQPLRARIAPGCCDGAKPGFAAAVPDGVPAQAPPTASPALLAFYAHCAACHALPAASPPGFLHGDLDAVERKLQRCAARIRFRLSMWGAPAAARTKVPMPPPLFVPAWEHAPPRADIERMLAYAARAMGAAAAAERGYEALPQCREHGMDAHDARGR